VSSHAGAQQGEDLQSGEQSSNAQECSKWFQINCIKNFVLKEYEDELLPPNVMSGAP
jgi:hypothetical protein